jgi:phage host-nuclease inhibitor protein Gam
MDTQTKIPGARSDQNKRHGHRKSLIARWEDVDRAMEQVARLDAELRVERANADALIRRIEQQYQDFAREREAERADLELALRKFASVHKKEFAPREQGGDTRSYEHAGVVMGYRAKPPEVRIENEEYALEWLRTFDDGIYVRVKLEANRQAIREALSNDADERTIERMAAHGITLQQRDKFFLEVRRYDREGD